MKLSLFIILLTLISTQFAFSKNNKTIVANSIENESTQEEEYKELEYYEEEEIQKMEEYEDNEYVELEDEDYEKVDKIEPDKSKDSTPQKRWWQFWK